jgi:selenocysteine-specific elongation factor
VRFHIGTAEVMGTLSLLDCDVVEPGQWGIAQVFLEEPAMATWGQPFVVRESSAMLTLGGGQVLQPVAIKVRRRHLEVLEHMERLWSGDVRERALTAAWLAGFSGITPNDLIRGANVPPDEAAPLIERLKEGGELVEISSGGARRTVLHRDLIDELEGRILTTLDRLHEEFPLMATHDRQKVQSQLSYVGDDSLVHGTVDRLIASKKLTGDLKRVGRADFKPKLSSNLRKLKDKMIVAYQGARFQPPEPASFAGAAGGNAASLRDLFDVCVAEGHLVQVSDDIYLHSDVDAQMKQLVTDRLGQQASGLTVAEIRDLLGTTRKYAVPLCEYLDRVGVTRREGDLRVLGSSTGEP